MTWNDVSAEIAIDKAIRASTHQKMFDNFSALAGGDPGAPRISRRAIHPGGAEIDGIHNDLSGDLALEGYYEWDALHLTGARTFPWLSRHRVNGDCVIAGVVTVDGVTPDVLANKAPAFHAVIGRNGRGGEGGGGGGSVGSGGHGSWPTNPYPLGGEGINISGFQRYWAGLPFWLGGIGGGADDFHTDPSNGGGCVILIVHGDVDMTGGTIYARGANGSGGSYSASAPGGGGGGGIIVICVIGVVHVGVVVVVVGVVAVVFISIMNTNHH